MKKLAKEMWHEKDGLWSNGLGGEPQVPYRRREIQRGIFFAFFGSAEGHLLLEHRGLDFL